MSSIGHVADSASRNKQNRRSTLERRERTSNLRQMYIGRCREENLDVLSSLTPEQMESVKDVIRKTAISERRRALIIAFTAALVSVLIIAVVLFYITT